MSGLIFRPGHIPAQEFRVAMPLATHWERATCEQVRCPNFLRGWKTVLPVDSELISVLKSSGRSYREEREEDGLVTFVFAPGQPCFRASEHRQQSDRPGLLIVHNREATERRLFAAHDEVVSGRIVAESEWIERSMETLDGLRQLREP